MLDFIARFKQRVRGRWSAAALKRKSTQHLIGMFDTVFVSDEQHIVLSLIIVPPYRRSASLQQNSACSGEVMGVS